jgi:hypothetical protein
VAGARDFDLVTVGSCRIPAFEFGVDGPAYRTAHPDVTVDNLNVWEEGLPEFDSEAIGGRTGLEPTEEELRHAPENPGPHRPAPRLDPTCCKASGMEVSCANRIEDEIQYFVQTLPVRKGCVMPIE